MAQRGGGAGRWSGPGKVYVMSHGSMYKIGCTGRDPPIRLEEIRSRTGNKNIQLVGSVKANQMREAETAAQNAVVRRGLVKDGSRGGATDWFFGPMNSDEVMNAVRQAVYNHNANHK